MFARRYFSLFTKAYASLKPLLQSISHKTKRSAYKKTVAYSPLAILLSTALLQCDEKQGQAETSQLEQLTMPELVQVLHQKPSKQFVVVIYDKFKKNKNPQLFASQLKNIVEQCKLSNIHTIYTISSKNAEYLKDIVRRLNNEPATSQQSSSSSKQNLKTFQCYFKSKSYPEAFELINSKDYKIREQIKEIRHFEIKINQVDLLQQLTNHMNRSFNTNKSIVVKECLGKGECVDSFRREVKNLMDSGLLTHKSQEYEFKLVVDYPSGILNKSTEYTKAFQTCVEELSEKKSIKKDDTYLFRRDMLGKQMVCWSEWMAKEGSRFEAEERMMMFVRPRVQIISKCSTFTDLMWYLRTSRVSRHLSLSLNNTQKWMKSNTQTSVQVLKLLHTAYPFLNYLIINSKSAGEIFHHVYCDHKYVLFQQNSSSVWNKQFLDLDKLQQIQSSEQRLKIFDTQFKTKISSFIDHPTKKNLTVVEKEHQINLEKLKNIVDRQKKVASNRKERQYIIRVCQERCGRYLKQQVIQQLEKQLNEKVNVYWIDSTCQNIGVPTGDYLLSAGNLTELHDFLGQKQQHNRS